MDCDKLYKRNVDGSIQVWWLELDNDRYRTHSGRLNGKIVTSTWNVAEATNEGRSNERDPIQQAKFIVESIYTRRLERGYSKTVEGVDETEFFKPMLAQTYKAGSNIFKNEKVFSQPKLDGVRCIITQDGMFSRNGKPIVTCPHIFEAFSLYFEDNPEIMFDGELYNHEFKEDFNRIISLVRRTKEEGIDFSETERLVQFHWYDIVTEGTYEERMSLKKMIAFPDFIHLVETTEVKNEDEVLAEYERYVIEGYEGQMLRLNSFSYENKRSKALLKHKSFVDTEFKIIDIEEGNGNRSRMAGFIVCQLPDGRHFHSSVMGSHEYAKSLLRNKAKFVGGDVTVKHFGYTPAGVPRFPVAKVLYDVKRDM